MPEGLTFAASSRYLAFAILALVLPGIGVQRLLRVRVDPALVLPLGLGFSALAYWLALVSGSGWLFPVLVLVFDASLFWTRLAWADGPLVRRAFPALVLVVLCLGVSVYRQDQLAPDGALLTGGAQADDRAFHVGLAFELTQGYPPQVPGLSGFPLDYHLGAPLLRAAALRYAGVHPYDALSRFENTLCALALILGLRGAMRALGGTPLAIALVGFSVLASDLSFLLAPGKGIEWWVGVFEGGTGLQSLFHANSLVPALALALGSLVALRRHLDGEGRGFLWLSALAALACPFFKVFVGAQLLGALAVAALFASARRASLVPLGAVAFGLLPLLLGHGVLTMQWTFEPLRVLNDARADLGFSLLRPAGLWLFLPVWLALSLGLRVVGLRPALRALVSREPVAVALSAFALAGWPLGLLLRISPLEAGPRDRPFNEALYFFETSGFALWLFAALAVGAWRLADWRRPAVLSACALLALPSTLQFVRQERRLKPRRLSPAIVAATRALVLATRAGDVVLVKPERQRYPPPPLIVGRRVPFTRFIPFFAQLERRDVLRGRYERVAAFFETTDAAEARAIARELGASSVCLFGADELRFPKADLLDALFEQGRARVYRIR